MPSMNVPVVLTAGDIGTGELELSVEFTVTSHGAPASPASMDYPGHPSDPMEIEVDHVYWPYTRKAADGKVTHDHVDMPWSALPEAVGEAIYDYIAENYEDDGPGDDY